MRVEVQVGRDDADRVLRKVSPGSILAAARAAMDETLAIGQTTVQAGTPVDLGVARASVFTQTEGTSLDGLSGRVAHAPGVTYFPVLEAGRGPGVPPPAAAIRPWVLRHGMPESAVFAVARAIGRRGLPAHRMWAAGVAAMRQAIPGIWQRRFGAL